MDDPGCTPRCTGSSNTATTSTSTESLSRVLVTYVGGTIGMKNSPNGYQPAPGYLTKVVASMRRFHDPRALDQALSPTDKSYVHRPSTAGSSDTDKEDRNRLHVRIDQDRCDSGGTNTATEDAMRTAAAPPADANVSLLSGTHFGSNDSLPPISPAAPFHAATHRVRRSFQELTPTLITPPSLYGKRIRYTIMESVPLLDSSNMTMADWVRIATDIELNYEYYDAFVVLHGTDTMSYTASALSFMLENLGKTVILTGSQVPLAEVRNDAIENLLGALTIAGHFVIPEVCLYFNNKLFRGNRTTKIDAVDFNAFESPNMRPLVNVGVNIDVNWGDVFRPNTIMKFRSQTDMNPNVATLRLFPGITESTIRAFLAPPIQGVVLESYGAGNAPDSREDVMRALKDASDRGVVIVNCTQCKRGTVTDAYATGKALLKVGVIPGIDMTPECALVKLSYLLGCNYSPAQCRTMIRQNLRGELTVVAERPRFAYNSRYQTLVQAIVAAASAGNTESGDATEKMQIPHSERLLIEKDLYCLLVCSAAGSDDVESLKMLEGSLGHTVQMNCADYDGRTPLHIAAAEGYTRCVEALLLSGASVHLRDRGGHTALFDAVRFRHEDVVHLLRRAGAHFHGDEAAEVAIRMMRAAAAGEVSKLKLYVMAGADLNQSAMDGRTVLHAAAVESRVEVVAFLLSQPDVDPAPQDRWSRTPLDDAEHAVALTGRGGQVVDMLREAVTSERRRRDSEKVATEIKGVADIVGDRWIE